MSPSGQRGTLAAADGEGRNGSHPRAGPGRAERLESSSRGQPGTPRLLGPDGGRLSAPLRIDDLAYTDALAYDFGIWFSRKYAGTRIPLLEEALIYAQKSGMEIKLDNKYQSFNRGQKQAFFELIAPYQRTASLTCSSVEEIAQAAQAFSQMRFHYDGPVTPDVLEALSAILPRKRLTVWLPLKNRNTEWVKIPFATEALAETVRMHAQLGIWLLSSREELEWARQLGADVVETDGQLKPERRRGVLADMHMHSRFSHDSQADINEMLQAAIDRGTGVMAVTDHCDLFRYSDEDIYTPLIRAHEQVDMLKRRDARGMLLCGVEIGEGFWFPDVCRKVEKLLAHDVIIGSVHCVRFGDTRLPYSAIDFSAYSQEAVCAYVDAYFDDVLCMLRETDIDVLAHLTCPLRYINGKYGRSVELGRCAGKIEEILAHIIRSGIALEVNTSSFDLLGGFMPDREILVRYREMGGYLITLGSDAHTPHNASIHFGKAVSCLREIGFTDIFYYQNSRSCQCRI